MLNDQLTSSIAGIILKYVKSETGRMTWISDTAGINRREFNRNGLAKMKLHRLLRIIYALALCMDEEQFENLMYDISDSIVEYMEHYDETLLTERKNLYHTKR